VLNGGHWVSPQSRAAVEAAIRVTGYRANPHARSLATGRAGSIAFLLTEEQSRLFEDPVFPLLLRGATTAASVHGIQVVVLVAGTAEEERRVVDYIADGYVDGVLHISRHRGDTVLGALRGHEVPIVTLGTPLGLEGKVSSASADDHLGGRMATEHLLRLGRRRIATITGPMDTPGGTLRLQGYREALGDAYDESLVVHGDYLTPSGRAAMEQLLTASQPGGAARSGGALQAGDEPIDAVFAHNDLMALGAIEVLHEAGLRVPDDVAVIGFDDSGVGARSTPALTTMRQPFDRLSSEMVRLLVDAIDGGPPATVTLPAELVIRESA